MDARKSRINLGLFTLVAVSSGWLGKWVDQQQLHVDPITQQNLGMMLWLFLPLLMMVGLRLFRGEGFKHAGLQPGRRETGKWYVNAVAMMLVIVLVVLVSGYIDNGVLLSHTRSTSYRETVLVWLPVQFVNVTISESLWRGYVLQKGLQLKWPDWVLYPVNGLLWSLWVLPYHAGLIVHDSLRGVLPTDGVHTWLIFWGVLTAWSAFYGEIYRLTCSVWPGVVTRVIHHTFVVPLLSVGVVAIKSSKVFWYSPFVGAVSVGLYALVALCLRQYRLRLQRTQAPHR